MMLLGTQQGSVGLKFKYLMPLLPPKFVSVLGLYTYALSRVRVEGDL